MIRKEMRRLAVWVCRCERCGYEWQLIGKEPKRCPDCKSRYWNIPKGTLPIGRPPKKSS